jgi:gas vesicle protein
MRELMNGVIFGAIVAFLFDPISGNRRRALARDKFNRYRGEMMDFSDKFVRDKRNRMEGMKHRIQPGIEDFRNRMQPRIEDLRNKVQPGMEELRHRVQPLIERGRAMLDKDHGMDSGRMNPI